MKIDRVDGSARVIGGGCDGPWGAEHMRAPLAIMDEPAGHAATWMGCFAIAATALAWMTDIARTISQFIDHGLQDSRFISQTIA